MKIVICDDDEFFLNKLNGYISKILSEKQVNKKILSFKSGEEFLRYYEKSKDIDMVFLDILMKDITGIQVAKKIREQDTSMQIFFVTSISRYIMEGYNVRAANYLIKPVKYNTLYRELNKTMKFIQSRNKKYVLEKNDLGNFKINQEDIRYDE